MDVTSYAGCATDQGDNCATGLSEDEFTYKTKSYRVTEFYIYQSRVYIGFASSGGTASAIKTALSGLTLTLGSGSTAKTFGIDDATVGSFNVVMYWTQPAGLSWNNNQQVAVALTAPATTTDTTRPTVTAAQTGYFGEAALTTALTGPLKAGTAIYTKVTFSEDMKHTKSDAAAARPELFLRIGTTDTQYDILDNGDTLASGDCKPNHATNTDVYVCLYTVGASDNGAFAVKAGTNSVDKADNALASAYTHAATLILDNTAPAAPSALALESPSSSPGTDSTPTVRVTVGETGGTVTLYSDSACTTAASAAADVTDTTSPYTVDVTAYALGAGSTTFHAKHTDAATNASGCSSQSVAYVNNAADAAPALSAVAGNARAMLVWDNPRDAAIVKWQERRSPKSSTDSGWTDWTDMDFAAGELGGWSGEKLYRTVKGLTNGTAYRFQVRPVRGTGNDAVAGAASVEAAATPEDMPAVRARAVAAKELEVVWTGGADATRTTGHTVEWALGESEAVLGTHASRWIDDPHNHTHVYVGATETRAVIQ